MKWKEYYEKYLFWADSTQYSRLGAVTDFGPESSPSSEIALCIQDLGEQASRRLMRLAVAAGVVFTPEEIAQIAAYGPENNTRI